MRLMRVPINMDALWVLSLSMLTACVAIPMDAAAGSHSLFTCEPITLRMCQELPYNATFMPNIMNHYDQQTAALAMEVRFLCFTLERSVPWVSNSFSNLLDKVFISEWMNTPDWGTRTMRKRIKNKLCGFCLFMNLYSRLILFTFYSLSRLFSLYVFFLIFRTPPAFILSRLDNKEMICIKEQN